MARRYKQTIRYHKGSSTYRNENNVLPTFDDTIVDGIEVRNEDANTLDAVRNEDVNPTNDGVSMDQDATNEQSKNEDDIVDNNEDCNEGNNHNSEVIKDDVDPSNDGIFLDQDITKNGVDDDQVDAHIAKNSQKKHDKTNEGSRNDAPRWHHWSAEPVKIHLPILKNGFDFLSEFSVIDYINRIAAIGDSIPVLPDHLDPSTGVTEKIAKRRLAFTGDSSPDPITVKNMQKTLEKHKSGFNELCREYVRRFWFLVANNLGIRYNGNEIQDINDLNKAYTKVRYLVWKRIIITKNDNEDHNPFYIFLTDTENADVFSISKI